MYLNLLYTSALISRHSDLHSTPVSLGLKDASSTRDSYNDEAVQGLTFLSDKLIREYPVTNFIEDAYGFRPSDLVIPANGYTLNWRAARNYIGGKYSKGGERSAYKPLMTLLQHLMKQVRTAMKDSSASHDTGIKIVNTSNMGLKGYVAEFKPDFIWSWSVQGMEQQWIVTGLSGELKKSAGGRKDEFLPTSTIAIDLKQIAPVRIVV